MAARSAVLALSVLSALALVAVSGCGDGGSGPVIDSVSPKAGQRGAQVEIMGARFCGDEDDAADDQGACTTPPAGFVNFGIEDPVVRANVVAWMDERITVTVPNMAATGATVIVVTVGGVSSNAADFSVQ
jgi:hypothetical protein